MIKNEKTENQKTWKMKKTKHDKQNDVWNYEKMKMKQCLKKRWMQWQPKW